VVVMEVSWRKGERLAVLIQQGRDAEKAA